MVVIPALGIHDILTYDIFFVKDRVDKGEITIQYCPTYRMLADYFTKPLQGKQFNAYRRVLMGWDHISELNKLTRPTIKERVGISNQNTSSDLNSNIVMGGTSTANHLQKPTPRIQTIQ